MHSTIKRLLTVGTAVAISLVGFVPAAPAQAGTLPVGITHAAAKTTAVTKAANWLAANPATADDGYGYQLYNATGLALAATPATAAKLRLRVKELRTGVAAVHGKPGTAASLTILTTALHLNPTNFGGVNLVSEITSGITADGQVGAYGSAFGQASAIIALKRAGKPVPAAVVTKLLSFRDATSGAFGYEYNGFVADPDSTALAIQALNLVGGQQAVVTQALTWAKSTQDKLGYWTSWSPIDSTALMASSFSTVKPATAKSLSLATSYANASRWLKSKQLANGGFASTLEGTSADQMATYDATYLLTGKAMATFSYKLTAFTHSVKPKLLGTAKVGKTLTVKTGAFRPSAEVRVQWLRSGHAIAGATATSYLLTSADAGKKIKVKVTYTQVGVKTVVKYTAAKKIRA